MLIHSSLRAPFELGAVVLTVNGEQVVGAAGDKVSARWLAGLKNT
jgi:hypothetical protein